VSPGAFDGVPGPVRRVVGLTVAGAVVYAVLLGLGAVLFSPAAVADSNYRFTSVLAAALAAYYLVYSGGFARLRDLLR